MERRKDTQTDRHADRHEYSIVAVDIKSGISFMITKNDGLESDNIPTLNEALSTELLRQSSNCEK